MDELKLYVPKLNDLRFRQQMMADPATMSYNAGYDLDFVGYHKDTGCIDFPESEWAAWYERWMGREPERFYAYIERSSDSAFLGEVCFHHTPEKDWWDMGVVLFAPCRGRGYSAPALRFLLDHAFCDCGVERLHNEFETSRRAALRLHLAAGFRETGAEDGCVHLTLTKNEYKEKIKNPGGFIKNGKARTAL